MNFLALFRAEDLNLADVIICKILGSIITKPNNLSVMKSLTFLKKHSVIGRAVSTIVFCGLFLGGNQVVSANSIGSQNYQGFKPLLEKVDLSKLQIEDDSRFDEPDGKNCAVIRQNFCIAIGRYINTPDSKSGVRLFLIERVNGGFKIRYQSKGEGDAYNFSPNFYHHPSNGSWIILAELGTEYSWGAQVFIVDQEQVVNIGHLDVAVGGAGENLSSVVPYTIITEEGVNTVFKFTRDVIKDPGGNNEKYISKNRIRYVYDGQRFQEIIAPEQKQQTAQKQEFPDKIIASKKMRGKFVKTIWGDYFYAIVLTKAGEEIFLIDGNESCFLFKYPQEQLLIDYDVVDRYTPQAGGYGQVNIIRNITTRKTTLQKWQRTVTKAELDQCEKAQR
jgi:hypothetical protein